MFLRISMITLMSAFLAACSSGKGGSGKGVTGGNPDNKNGGGSCSSSDVLVPDDTKGGCRIRLVTPSQCEEVDLSGGRSYEIAWTTDGTVCETAWTIFLAGSPANVQTGDNVASGQLGTNGNTITQKGGVLNIVLSDLDSVKSDDGTYHWMIQSHGGSHPASVKFKVKK